MSDRRTFLKGAIAGTLASGASIAGPLAAFPEGKKKEPYDDQLFFAQRFPMMEQIAILPAKDGKIVSMVNFRDDVYIATEYGTIYRLSDLAR